MVGIKPKRSSKRSDTLRVRVKRDRLHVLVPSLQRRRSHGVKDRFCCRTVLGSLGLVQLDSILEAAPDGGLCLVAVQSNGVLPARAPVARTSAASLHLGQPARVAPIIGTPRSAAAYYSGRNRLRQQPSRKPQDGETKYRGLGSIAVDCVEAMTDIGLVHVDTYDRREALRLQAMEESAGTRKRSGTRKGVASRFSALESTSDPFAGPLCRSTPTLAGGAFAFGQPRVSSGPARCGQVWAVANPGIRCYNVV